jgi:hypothetical protein
MADARREPADLGSLICLSDRRILRHPTNATLISRHSIITTFLLVLAQQQKKVDFPPFKNTFATSGISKNTDLHHR